MPDIDDSTVILLTAALDAAVAEVARLDAEIERMCAAIAPLAAGDVPVEFAGGSLVTMRRDMRLHVMAVARTALGTVAYERCVFGEGGDCAPGSACLACAARVALEVME